MKDKIEKFIERWKYMPAESTRGEHVTMNMKPAITEELLSLLKEVAEKAFNVGYDQIEYPAETAFADYWKSVTDKIK